MVQNGTFKVKKDLRDYDFLKSRALGGVSVNADDLPSEFNVDAGLWMPNQNQMGLPYGCTGFTQADLCADEDGVLYDPGDIYRATPTPLGGDPNGGRNIRESLAVVCKKDRPLKRYLADGTGNPRPAYFTVKPAGKIDYFDAVRIAIWINQHEKRSVSIGSPWYPEFERPVDGILPTPESYYWHGGIPGHNWKICGWKTIDGNTYLIGKPWQGEEYGDNGWCYVSREIFNDTMNRWGTGAFTVSDDSNVATVDKSVVDRLVAFIYQLWAFGTTYIKF